MMPVRARRPEARPEEILSAALEEFMHVGFDAARMDDIARRASLSKPGLYLYFDSKQGLLEALIEARIVPLADHMSALVLDSPVPPPARLRMMLGFALARLQDPKLFAIPRLIISLSSRFPELAQLYRRRVIDPVRQTLAALIRQGQANGQFRADIDADVAVLTLIGPVMITALMTHVLDIAPQPTAEAQSNALIDQILKGLEPCPTH
ncbi:MAG: TetR/AcrR family transcriptional regulator [Asticcacaulis sp.]